MISRIIKIMKYENGFFETVFYCHGSFVYKILCPFCHHEDEYFNKGDDSYIEVGRFRCKYCNEILDEGDFKCTSKEYFEWLQEH